MADAEPISLYIDLEPEQIADLEVVARAAIAWAEGIKEIAYILDPAAEVRIELASGSEGSLSLNSLIRLIRGTGDPEQRKKDLRTIRVMVLVWLLLEGASYTFTEVVDALRGQNDPLIQQMTDEQMNELADRVARRLSGVAREQRQQVYRELERDQAVRGVGVSLQHGHRPAQVVPRSDFPRRSGAVVEETEARKRKHSRRLRVTLISPTLKGVPRSWRFQVAGMPEFGATMKDTAFLEAVEDGRVSIPLRTGVEMEIEVVSREEHEGGVWVTKERSVTRVYSPDFDRSNELPLG